VDQQVLEGEAKKFKERKKSVQLYRDFRKLMEDKSIDVVSIATPDHWHVPISAHAILLGKDVYVEKPLSHTISEGRYLVDLAKKYHKIVQVGTQNRSRKNTRNAIKYLKSGELGKIRLAKAINHQLRQPIGRIPDSKTPDYVDYDLWLGPAPKRLFNQNRFHYNWHWFWDYGSGDTGNDGIHQIDLARWGLGVGFPEAVTCSGKQLFYQDDHETPDTQIATFEYKNAYLMYEMRLWTDYKMEGHDNGNIFYGDNGILSIGRKGWQVTFKDGSEGPGEEQASDTHAENFVEAIRTRNLGKLNSDVKEGHISSSLCHMANIAMKVGQRLNFDSNKEEFVNNHQANQLLTKIYRKGYELPEG
jgi:predicted dehydrogenase